MNPVTLGGFNNIKTIHFAASKSPEYNEGYRDGRDGRRAQYAQWVKDSQNPDKSHLSIVSGYSHLGHGFLIPYADGYAAGRRAR